MPIHPDDYGFEYSSDSEWDRAEACQLGELYPERAWINTDRDVWHKNPFYVGPPVPHPEDDPECEGAEFDGPAGDTDPGNYETDVSDPWPEGDECPF